MKRVQIISGVLFCLFLLTGCSKSNLESDYKAHTHLPNATQLNRRAQKANKKGTLSLDITMSLKGEKKETEYNLVGHTLLEYEFNSHNGYISSNSRLYKDDELFKQVKEEYWSDNTFGYYRTKEKYDDWTSWQRVSRSNKDSIQSNQIDSKLRKYYNVRTKGQYYIAYVNEDTMYYSDAQIAMNDYIYDAIIRGSELKIDREDLGSSNLNIELAYDKKSGALVGGIYEYSNEYIKYKVRVSVKDKTIKVPSSVIDAAVDK